MCLKTPPPPAGECDCYECVEERRGAGKTAAAPREDCPERAQCPDPLDSWRSAFHEAYREVQLEIFKAKIKAGMSKTMEKTAELVLETMMAEMGENLRRAKFQKQLRDKLEKLIESAGEV